MTDLIIVGDEAWTLAEWEAQERRLAKRREYNQRPEVRARKAAWFREYRKRPEVQAKHRAYNREWMRFKRGTKARLPLAGFLHELACNGQHYRPRKSCKPIPMYYRLEKAA